MRSRTEIQFFILSSIHTSIYRSYTGIFKNMLGYFPTTLLKKTVVFTDFYSILTEQLCFIKSTDFLCYPKRIPFSRSAGEFFSPTWQLYHSVNDRKTCGLIKCQHFHASMWARGKIVVKFCYGDQIILECLAQHMKSDFLLYFSYEIVSFSKFQH